MKRLLLLNMVRSWQVFWIGGNDRFLVRNEKTVGNENSFSTVFCCS